MQQINNQSVDKYILIDATAISVWMEMIRQNKPLRLDGDGEGGHE